MSFPIPQITAEAVQEPNVVSRVLSDGVSWLGRIVNDYLIPGAHWITSKVLGVFVSLGQALTTGAGVGGLLIGAALIIGIAIVPEHADLQKIALGVIVVAMAVLGGALIATYGSASIPFLTTLV